ncbi:alkaline phosphatase family protein [Porphyromonas loveana]|uniref:alkaline phosphatase family protein n=1 Tax=Porphyromonas loveana TaxID=1884669 RepID=UPI00359F3BF5
MEKERSMKRLVTTLLAVLAISGGKAQAESTHPKLVVVITIDQLRGDLLSYCIPEYGPGGFNRLLNNGLVFSNVDFGFDGVDEASAIAGIYTGTYPNRHGITGSTTFDTEKNSQVSILEDKNYLGNYTSERLSPQNLQSETIGDELRAATDGRSKVYAIAPNAVAAIVAAGQSGNGAFWIEDRQGKWATTTYYKDFPWYIDRFNSLPESPSSRINNIVWTPVGAPQSLPAGGDPATFSYRFSQSNIPLFKRSAPVNEEVTTLALRLIEYGGLELAKQPNLLSLTYYAGRYPAKQQSEHQAEMIDTYRRLDAQIARLLTALDKKIGLAHCIIALSGTGHFESSPPTTSSAALKRRRYFSPKRCKALINMYLMALHGQGQWVLDYTDGRLILDKKLAEKKQLDIRNLQSEVAEFARQMSGVRFAMAAHEVGSGMVNEEGLRFARSFKPGETADVCIQLQGGWIEGEEESPTDSQQKQVRYDAVAAPFILFTPTSKGEKVHRTISSTEIAPTLAYILRIRPPTDAKALPLPEVTI